MKIHLGCGHNLLEGWINVDNWPIPPKPGIIFVKHDLATGLGCFKTGAAHFIFTEHFLEHLTREQGLVLLEDCRRVLRPGGVIRVVVPDLAYLISKYLAKDLNWGGAGGWEPQTPCRMVNQSMRAWGHQFIYDHDELVSLFRDAGFKALEFPKWRESLHPELASLECRPKYGDLRFEATR